MRDTGPRGSGEARPVTSRLMSRVSLSRIVQPAAERRRAAVHIAAWPQPRHPLR